jgi:hypothetical protein
MIRSSICRTALAVFALAGAIAPATAQLPAPPATSARPQDAPAAVGTPKNGTPKKKAGPSGANVAGNWSGEITQVDSSTPFKLDLAISDKAAQTRYPDLDCTGSLMRVGSSKSYVFFVETITKGRADTGGRCPDGALMVARQGNNLALSWFGSIGESTVIAYGVLSRK